MIEQFKSRLHNPQYLLSAKFAINQLSLSTNAAEVVNHSDVIVIAIPSAYVADALEHLPRDVFKNKKIVSAVKGIIPGENLLLNDYLEKKFDVSLKNYYAVLGPCHAEEVAQEKLSYLTFSGMDEKTTAEIASKFSTPYINARLNKDIIGVQYAAVLKNIYAVGAGIAHGLDYGDNFLSVLIANSADEMAGFLRKAGILNAEVGYMDHSKSTVQDSSLHQDYAASVYLGDLLVTCYSPHSRNRTFGNMIGKGYNVLTAQLEMSMVAEGYHASKCMSVINQSVGAEMPIANAVYNILWNDVPAETGFAEIEQGLV